MRLHRLAGLLATLLLGLPLLLTAAPAGADQAADARAERERARTRRAALAADIDGLKASESELRAAVAALDDQIRGQRAIASAARRAAAAAEVEAQRARAALELVKEQRASLRQRIVDRGVAEYLRPAAVDLPAFDDVTDAAARTRRRSLLGAVAGRDDRLFDQFRATEEDLGLQRAASARAVTLAQERQQAAGHRLEALEQTRTERERVAGALEGRIAEVVAESEALAAQEEQLTAIIAEAEERSRREAADRSRREAAQAERARQAAAERAAQAEAARRARPRQAAPAPAPAPAPSGGSSPSGAGLVWPLRGPVTSEYGPRWGRLHAGLDIARETGAAIVAAGSGRVIYSGSMSGYGNVVMIDHGGRLTTVYAHQSRIAVRDGASVGRGEVIGYVGSTGRSTGPHLHFETRVGGSPRNPRNYLP